VLQTGYAIADDL